VKFIFYPLPTSGKTNTDIISSFYISPVEKNILPSAGRIGCIHREYKINHKKTKRNGA